MSKSEEEKTYRVGIETVTSLCDDKKKSGKVVRLVIKIIKKHL
jgi:hypothetical protein